MDTTEAWKLCQNVDQHSRVGIRITVRAKNKVGLSNANNS